MSKTFVIIVTYNGSKWIETCLKSIETSNEPLKVIVVDNNSKDNTLNIIRSKFPDTILIDNKKNFGFGKSNNLGIKKALELGGEYFFLLNQDAFIESNTIKKLIDVSRKNTDFGILSPLHCIWEMDSLDKAFTGYMSYENNPYFISDFVLNRIKKIIYEVPFVAASGWLLTKLCIETVGGFDPIFFYLGEDVNYCQRVRFHGLKIGVVPDSIFYHDTKKRHFETPRMTNKDYFDYSNKIKFANLLEENIEIRIYEEKKKYKKKILKYMITFEFGKLKKMREEYQRFNKLLDQCYLSVNKNKVKRANYI